MTARIDDEPSSRFEPEDIRGTGGPRSEHLVLHVVALAVAVCGVGILLSAVVDAIDGGPDVFATAGDRCACRPLAAWWPGD